MGYPISYVQIVSSALDFSKESDPSKLQRRWQQKLDLAYIHRIHTPSTYSYSFIARDALAFTWPSRNIIPHTYDAPEKILGSALLQTRIYWIYLIFIEFHLMTNQCFIEHLIVKSINVVKIENWKIVIVRTSLNIWIISIRFLYYLRRIDDKLQVLILDFIRNLLLTRKLIIIIASIV